MLKSAGAVAAAGAAAGPAAGGAAAAQAARGGEAVFGAKVFGLGMASNLQDLEPDRNGLHPRSDGQPAYIEDVGK